MQINRTKVQLSQLTQELQQQKVEYQKANDEFLALKTQIATFQKQKIELSTVQLEYEQVKQNLQIINKQLAAVKENENASKAAVNAAVTQLKKIQGEIKIAQMKTSDLNEKQQYLTMIMDKIAVFKKKLQLLMDEISAFEKQKTELSSVLLEYAKLKKDIASLEASKKTIGEDIAKMKGEKDILSTDLLQFQSSIGELQKKQEILKEKIMILEKDSSELSAHNHKIILLRQTAIELEQQNQKSKSAILSLNTKKGYLEKEITKLTETYSGLQGQVDRLEHDKSVSRLLKQQVIEAKKELQSVNDEIVVQQKVLSTLIAQLSAKKNALDAEVRLLELQKIQTRTSASQSLDQKDGVK